MSDSNRPITRSGGAGGARPPTPTPGAAGQQPDSNAASLLITGSTGTGGSITPAAGQQPLSSGSNAGQQPLPPGTPTMMSVPASEWIAMQQMVQQLLSQRQQPRSATAAAGDSNSNLAPHQPASPQPGAPTADLAAIARELQDAQARQTQQLASMMQAQAAQTLLLQSLGEFPTYNGKGADTTLVATEWLQRAEGYFAAREQALGLSAAQGDSARVLSAANALQDDARRWYNALPRPHPATWADFVRAVRARFCSVPDERMRVDRLNDFVDKAARLRDKLNVQGMQAYTARFQQLAGEVPDAYITLHGKLALLARGLPQRYAEVVLKEDAKSPPPTLSEVVNIVLSRAAQKEQAISYGGASHSTASAAPINLDAVSLAATTFGWSREEAAEHLDDSNAEGWSVHDTNASGGASSLSHAQDKGASPSPGMSIEQMTQLAAMFGARMGDYPKKQSQRRNAPADVKNSIPDALADARKQAGLCIKCGIAKYEGGGKGHNARTCKAAADPTTSVAEGKKKAGLLF